jgi:uncharacterized protein
MEKRDLIRLVERCGESYVSKRLQIQVEHSARVLGPGVGSIHFENLDRALRLFGGFIKLLGGWNRGVSNIKRHKIIVNRVEIDRLPKAFNGLNILHLSDLHLDALEGMGRHIGRICSTLNYDVALITGDFRFHTHGNYYTVFKEIEELAKHLKCAYGCYGVLGNHDFLEFVPKLEAYGIRMLLNESAVVQKDGAELWIVGLDDAHFYGVHDYGRGLSSVPPEAAKVLMVHSPETLEEAYLHDVDFVTCGHTHGGQLCLPGGIPLWLNANCARKYCGGRWEYRGMPGYTSRGTGSSGLPIRFNCPPEIVVHQLVCAYPLTRRRASD